MENGLLRSTSFSNWPTFRFEVITDELSHETVFVSSPISTKTMSIVRSELEIDGSIITTALTAAEEDFHIL